MAHWTSISTKLIFYLWWKKKRTDRLSVFAKKLIPGNLKEKTLETMGWWRQEDALPWLMEGTAGSTLTEYRIQYFTTFNSMTGMRQDCWTDRYAWSPPHFFFQTVDGRSQGSTGDFIGIRSLSSHPEFEIAFIPSNFFAIFTGGRKILVLV